MSTQDQLREAIALAKAGNAFEARIRVDEILRAEPLNADAWVVMAQLQSDKTEAIRCLRQVIMLRPDDARAKKILAKLEREVTSTQAAVPLSEATAGQTASAATSAPSKGPDRQMLMLGGFAGVLLIVLLGAVFILMNGRKPQTSTTASGDASLNEDAASATVSPISTVPPRPTETEIPFVMDPETVAADQMLRGMVASPHNQQDWLLQTGMLSEVPSVTPTSYAVGTSKIYDVIVGNQIIPITFVLQYQNSVVDMWVQEGVPVNQTDLQTAADHFVTTIYPTAHSIFGLEWSPGIDGNPRLSIFNVLFLGMNVGGYYSHADEFPQEVYPYSNEQEAFYMSLVYGDVGSEQYMSTLAHEFQHMIRFNEDPNEANWMDEGMSQLAELMMGYNDVYNHMNYLFDSRVTLNGWSEDFRTSASHYGAAYLFNEYMWERYGTDVIKEIAHRPENGLHAVDIVLNQQGTSADALFSDWIVANYIIDKAVADGRYGYQNEQMIPICPRTRLAEAQIQRRESGLPQYSAHYLELEGEGEFTIKFRGNTDIPLINANPYSGKYMWWGNRENRSVTSLTRTFDLTTVEKASLQFWTWYEIQEYRDKGYVLISTDGGESWDFLESKHMVRDTHLAEFGMDYGPYYTGNSSGGSKGLWVNESISLTPYVGKQVMIRFQYVTDTYFEGNGWALDNIRIPEIGYLSDLESPEDGWVSDGWLRSANRIPQKWSVSVVHYDGTTTVEPLTINPDGTAETTLTLTAESGRATIIVGAMAPTTAVEATYSLSISGSGRMASLRNPPGVLLQEDFSQPCSVFTSFILPDYAYGYQNGEYQIRIDVDNYPIIAWGEGDFTNVVIEVDTVQKVSKPDSTTGIICRYLDEENFYVFQIAQDATHRVLKVSRGQPTALEDWTESTFIKTGDGAVNHLTATCNENQLAFNINGELVALLNDTSPLHHGDVAFYAASGEEPGVVVTFDNLVVKKP